MSAIYPNTSDNAHVLPDVVAGILGDLVEGGLFEMSRGDATSGVTLSSEVEPGDDFRLFVSEWHKPAAGMVSEEVLSMHYSWEGEFVSATLRAEPCSEDDAVEALEEIVMSNRFIVDSHEEVPA